MFTTENFFAKIWAGWFLIFLLSMLMLGIGPNFLYVPMSALTLFVLLWGVKCAYRSERFSDYATLRLFCNLSIPPFIASLLLMALTYNISGFGWQLSLLNSSFPLVVVYLAYKLVSVRGTGANVLILRKDKAEIDESRKAASWLPSSVGVVLTSMAYPLMNVYDPVTIIFVALLVFISLHRIFQSRMQIASLKALREREERERFHYTFQDVEYIRELRRTSFLGRFLGSL